MSRRNAPESKQADLFSSATQRAQNVSVRDAVDRIPQSDEAPNPATSKTSPSHSGNTAAGDGNFGKPPPKSGKSTSGEGPRSFLTVKQVAARYGVATSTIWRWSDELPDFPKPVRLGSGATRWKLDELLTYEAELRRTK